MNPKYIPIYDLETSDLDKDYGQVLEAAMVTLDENFDIIKHSELVLPVAPRIDVPPSPRASLVHGINFESLRERGMTEYDFAIQFSQYMSTPGSMISGYNTMGFDDEIMRRTLFRNGLDPYGHEWRDGNCRFDVLNLVRMLYSWDPESLIWPEVDDKVSLKLSDIAPINDVAHAHAHNALSDVLATAGLLKKISKLGSRVFDQALRQTDKREMKRLVAKRAPLFHSSSFYSAEQGYSSAILPLIVDSQSANKILCIDLTKDPSALLDMSTEEIRHYLFTPRHQLEENAPNVPVTAIQLNKQPSITEIQNVPPSLHQRMGVDVKECEEKARLIMSHRALSTRIQQAFKHDLDEPSDVYGTLYSGGFYLPEDTVRRDKMHQVDSNGLPAIASSDADELMRGATDPRLVELATRIKGLNFPGSLTSPKEQERFSQYLQRRLHSGEVGSTLEQAREEIDNVRLEQILSVKDEEILQDLELHLDWLESQSLQNDNLNLGLIQDTPSPLEMGATVGGQPYKKPTSETPVQNQPPQGRSSASVQTEEQNPSSKRALIDGPKPEGFRPCPF